MWDACLKFMEEEGDVVQEETDEFRDRRTGQFDAPTGIQTSQAWTLPMPARMAAGAALGASITAVDSSSAAALVVSRKREFQTRV